MLVSELNHLVLERIVRNQGQSLVGEVENTFAAGVGPQAATDTFHFNPFNRAHQGRDERTAMRDALALECQCFRENGGRVYRVNQVNGTIKRRSAVRALGDRSEERRVGKGSRS